jgi:hypothetical protein
LLPAFLAAWTLLGALGTFIAHRQGDPPRAGRYGLTIAGVWVIYIAALLLTAHLQPQRVIPVGQPECFERVCYTVVAVESVGEFKGMGGGQLVRVSIHIVNQSEEARSTAGLEPYLIDATGRIWPQTTGLGGVSLTLRLPAGGEATSQPVFRVQGTPPGMSLVLSRHHSGWHWLVIGDSDSPGHKPTLHTF